MKILKNSCIVWVSVLFISIISLFFSAGVSQASTDIVSGTVIDKNTTWTKADSPYILNEINMVVGEDVTLTIEPGVEVRAMGSSIYIKGRLVANGVKDDRIRFNSTIYGSPWMMVFEGKATSTITYTDFKHMRSGLIFQSSPADFSSVTISNSDYGIDARDSDISTEDIHIFDMNGDGFGAYFGSSFKISSTTIEDIHNGNAISLFNASSLVLDRGNIKRVEQNDGIAVFNSDAHISDSHLSEGIKERYKAGIGIYDSSAHGHSSLVSIDDSVLENLSYGLMVYGGKVTIKDSLIHKSIIGVESGYTPVDSSSSISISNSSILDNEEAGIENFSRASVDARNNWWGDVSGPDTKSIIDVTKTVESSPWLTKDPRARKVCCSNIVFIPGMEASELYDSSGDRMWIPKITSTIKPLFLDENGLSLTPDIQAKNIISSAYGKDIYQTFIQSMDSLVNDKVIEKWKPLPYDWRLDMGKIARDMVAELESIASTSKTGMVTVIAHSNGGLVGKLILNELEKAGKSQLVDKFILVASPQHGTPEAIAAVLHGDDQAIGGGAVVTARSARGLGINMPTAYNLLPSKQYFLSDTSPLVTFGKSVEQVNDFKKIYGDSLDSFTEYVDFLNGKDGRTKPSYDDLESPSVLNASLMSKAIEHHEVIDSWTPPVGIRVSEIAGWGLPTLKGIKYVGKKVCVIVSVLCTKSFILDHEPVLTDDGDKTVVSQSATALDSVSQFFLNLKKLNKNSRTNMSHADILEIDTVQSLIKNLVQDSVSTTTLSEYITVEKPIDGSQIRISVHSPVTLDVYDSGGNHTGPTATQTNPDSDIMFIEENIPNSSYIQFGEGQYVTLDSGDTYKVSLRGTDLGTFSLNITESLNDEEIASTTYADIPVDEGSIVNTSFTNARDATRLDMDIDGDGTVDKSITPESILSPIDRIGVLEGVLKNLIQKNGQYRFLLAELNIVREFIKKNKTDSVLKHISIMEEKISRLPEKKIQQKEKDKIIAILEIIKIYFSGK